MNLAILGITALALLLALLLLSLNIRARWPLTLKALVTLLTFAALALGYLSLHRLLGWPAPADPPADARLLAGEILEPSKNGTPGAIYLWLTSSGAPAPRAYAFPYSQELHQAVAEALRRKTRGEEIVLREGGAVRMRGEFGRARAIQFQAVEKPQLPEKQ
jgi:hypothetical protein